MLTTAKPHAKFFGRKASPCRKCGGVGHYVNKLGGIVCRVCSPPRDPAGDVRGELTIEGGVWIDPDDRFDMIDVPRLDGSASATSPPGTPPTPTTGPVPQPGPRQTDTGPNWSVYSRGPSNEYSVVEMNLFASDEIWRNAEDQMITLRSSSMRPMRPTQDPTCQGAVVARAKNEEERKKDSQGDIACRGALQDRTEAQAHSAQSRRSGCEGDASQDSGEADLVEVGEIVRVTSRVEMFQGPLSPATDYRLTSVWRDHYGHRFVNLANAKTGELAVTGLGLDRIRKV